MSKRFDVLDGFRGIAALMVAVYHLHVVGFITELNFVRNSYLFVEFFFVLSGFVIGYSYIGRLNNISDLKSFMKKRFARLWPLHMFVTILFVPVALGNVFLNIDLGDRFSFFAFVSNTFLIQALNVNAGLTWNVPSWSISVEFYTYFIFGIFFMFPYLKNALLMPILISLLSFCILFFNSSMSDATNYAIFRCTYSFFLGAIAFKIHDSINVKPWMEVAIIGVVALLLSQLKIESDSVLAFSMPLFFFLIIIIFSQQQGIVSRLLTNKHLKTLGVLSFSIYLTHDWFVVSIKALSKITEKVFDYKFMYLVDGRRIIDFGFGYFNDFIFIPYLILVVVFSFWTYKYIEKPFQEKINNM